MAKKQTRKTRSKKAAPKKANAAKKPPVKKADKKKTTKKKSNKPVSKKKPTRQPTKKSSRKAAKKPPVAKRIDPSKELRKENAKAKEYMDDPQRTEHLLDSALEKIKRNKGAIADFIDGLGLLIRLIKAWIERRYTVVPWKTILMAIATVIYFVNPFDLIPDFIPVVGYLDDAAVVAFTVRALSSDLNAFREWEKAQA